MDCPDHDELIRLKTIIDTDHAILEARVSKLEAASNRIVGIAIVLAGLSGMIGAVLGHVFLH